MRHMLFLKEMAILQFIIHFLKLIFQKIMDLMKFIDFLYSLLQQQEYSHQ